MPVCLNEVCILVLSCFHSFPFYFSFFCSFVFELFEQKKDFVWAIDYFEPQQFYSLIPYSFYYFLPKLLDHQSRITSFFYPILPKLPLDHDCRAIYSNSQFLYLSTVVSHFFLHFLYIELYIAPNLFFLNHLTYIR